jgi:hypothetical protein
MQWQNFLPLVITASLQDNTSFTIVGDQTEHYRFRGGESELMLNIINQKKSRQNLQPLNTSDSIGEVRILSISITGCMILCLRL